ncbi:MAG: Wzz/FepE/Etk N-terminal domain-containing protein [Syntrophomonas sp.]|uniref:Wzz/FepE/Etk N-terminal domain-containing protein n=1 Tax=Syntrophomonas sp. TaxID=2053627 RepID=UPI002628B4E3|nr:Wzz/FepE/Etk N-terminal domain-containing protein [Syntrophomonas sp.]MDD4627393.1 Wzz/FepE/Etk N-terminal domain-containing protein [Syntrophomonas sp.]
MDNIQLKDKLEITLKNEAPAIEEAEIDLRDIISSLIKGKKLILKVVVVTLLAALLFTMVSNPNWKVKSKAEVIVSFNFDGVEKGLDPDGKRFDLGKIKAPVVLDPVIEDLQLDKKKITVDDLRDNLEITPIVPAAIIEKIQHMIEAVPEKNADAKESTAIQTLEDYQYYPTRFIITLNIPKSMDADSELGEQILQEIFNSYTKYFYDTYSDRTVLADAITKINYAEYDYPEIPLIIRNQLDIMRSYLAGKSREPQGGNFRSPTTGLSFNDIRESLLLIDNIDLNNLSSTISAYRITKDKDQLIRAFEYRIKSYELRMAKNIDESRQTAEVRDRYQKEKSIMFMGGVGSPQGTLESEKTSPVYDELARRSLEAGVTATDTQHDIEYIKREIVLFQTDVDIPPEVKKQKEEQVVVMIAQLDAKLKTWIGLTNKTLDDYFEKVYFDRAIMQTTPVQSSHPGMSKLGLNLAIALVLGLMIGVFVALFKDYWENSGKATDSAAEPEQVQEESVTESI